MSTRNNARKLNNALTKRVINWHDKGYTDDFLAMQDQRFFCLQNSQHFHLADLSIELVDEGFDQLTKTRKYIHIVETSNGSKGLLLSDVNCCGEMLVN